MKTRKLITMAAAAAMAMSYTQAAEATAPAATTDWTDSVKKALTVYKDDDAFVKQVRFSWMEQWQMVSVQPNGSNRENFKPGAHPFNQEFRRSWVGMNVNFATNTEFHVWGRIGGLPSRETFVGGKTKKTYTMANIFDLWIKQDITAVKGLSVKAGKIKPLFTTDYSTPSSAIPCIERSILANQYNAPDSNWGVEVTWTPNKTDKVYAQLMANDRTPTSGRSYSFSREFGWEDKCFMIIGGEHKFGVTESGYHKVSAQYLHDFNNTYGSSTHPRGKYCASFGFQDAVSVGYEYKNGPLTLITNVVASFEQEQGNGEHNIGWEIEPIFAINPHVDLVFRYVGIMGDGACKLRSDRYINTHIATDSAPTWADYVHTFYIGADIYASAKNKNALKLMLGTEYTTAHKCGRGNYNGWTFLTAIRWSF